MRPLPAVQLREAALPLLRALRLLGSSWLHRVPEALPLPLHLPPAPAPFPPRLFQWALSSCCRPLQLGWCLWLAHGQVQAAELAWHRLLTQTLRIRHRHLPSGQLRKLRLFKQRQQALLPPVLQLQLPPPHRLQRRRLRVSAGALLRLQCPVHWVHLHRLQVQLQLLHTAELLQA